MGYGGGESAGTSAIPFFTRPGEVNRESAVVNGFSVEHANGFFRLNLTAHHYKGEALRSSGVAVLDDIH